MPKYTAKSARERGDRFENSLEENAPEKDFAGMTLPQFKTKRGTIAAKEDQITATLAHLKTLRIDLKDLNGDLMTDCDYIAAAVEGDRDFGPDSALYAGFGYIRESEKKRGGRRTLVPAP
jgi:hypothetical protein